MRNDKEPMVYTQPATVLLSMMVVKTGKYAIDAMVKVMPPMR
jgi:hypothetical protein